MNKFATMGIAFALLLQGCDSSREPTEMTSENVDDLTIEKTPADEMRNLVAGDEQDSKPEVVEESAAVSEEAQKQDESLTLAKAEPAAAKRDWKFREGKHFQRLVPTQPTVGGPGKVEVAEFFWYGCGHCLEFEPYINRWAENKPEEARFVRVPAMWNPLVKLHAQLYYTEEVLAGNGKLADPEAFHEAVFTEYHQRGNRLASEAAIQKLFERFGVSAEVFQNTWKSFEVAQKMRVADDLARRYGITGVPSIVVNGKYRTGGSEAGGYPALLEVIDELVARETSS